MRTDNRLKKIRIIQQGKGTGGKGVIYGVSLPQYLESWVGVYVSVKHSGNRIILESGAMPIPFTKMQLRTYSKKVGDVYI